MIIYILPEKNLSDNVYIIKCLNIFSELLGILDLIFIGHQLLPNIYALYKETPPVDITGHQ